MTWTNSNKQRAQATQFNSCFKMPSDIFFSLFCALFSAVLCGGSTSSWAGEFSSRSALPDEGKILRWIDTGDAEAPQFDLGALPSKPLKCGESLYPSHPQQTLKQYHLSQWGEYDTAHIAATDPVCLIHTQGNPSQESCLRADTALTFILSDLFQDVCGNYYRGIVEISFLKSDETMGTLMSPGRTMYPNPKSAFPENDFISGGTYAVPKTRFLKLTEPFQGDVEKSKELLQESETGYKYNPVTHLFSENP